MKFNGRLAENKVVEDGKEANKYNNVAAQGLAYDTGSSAPARDLRIANQ